MKWAVLFFVVLALAGCGGAMHQTLGNVDTSIAEAKPAGADRKVITEANLKLVVTDLAKLEDEIPKLVKKCGGFMSQVLVDRTQGQHISGHWVARVPVDQYDSFLETISNLGVPDTFGQTAQDVTEEYVDLEARIANEKRLEERILELAKRPEGQIKDIVEVEQQLARVRGEIEKMEGRLRYLANRVALTTVTIDAIERVAYVPIQAPTFVQRIGQSWTDSVTALRHLVENLLLTAVVLLPWTLIALAILVPTVLYVRRHRKSQRVSSAAGGSF